MVVSIRIDNSDSNYKVKRGTYRPSSTFSRIYAIVGAIFLFYFTLPADWADEALDL